MFLQTISFMFQGRVHIPGQLAIQDVFNKPAVLSANSIGQCTHVTVSLKVSLLRLRRKSLKFYIKSATGISQFQ